MNLGRSKITCSLSSMAESLLTSALCSQKKTQKSSSTRVYSIFEFDYEYSSLNSIIKYRFLYSSLNSSILEFYRVFYYLINYIIIGYN